MRSFFTNRDRSRIQADMAALFDQAPIIPWSPIYNAWVSTTTVTGTPVFASRHIQLDDKDVNDDPGVVEIRADASTALAPILRKTLYDVTGSSAAPGKAGWARGDVVTITSYDHPEVNGLPTSLPFHVLRAFDASPTMPVTEVSLARVDIAMQAATLLSVITQDMPGSQPGPDFDPIRAQMLTDYDGRGWTITQNGVLRTDYLAPIQVMVGVNEYATTERTDTEGKVRATAPVVIYEAPLALRKYDLLALADGRRIIMADVNHQLQRMGVTIAVLRRAEYRDPQEDPMTYQISLT